MQVLAGEVWSRAWEMPDYIYLLENRLTRDQQAALQQIVEAARNLGFTVFLVGGAVRDLTSGASVRDLDVAVQGNALKLKKPLLKSGAALWGEHEPSHTLHLHFPVGVRVEISSTRSEEFPKPGKPLYSWDDIHADLRRRDFTANAMALSLNEHSYGLLMDPLNGVADIETRQLRLVSNYGFLEDPIRLVRATRLTARTGWEMEERSKARYLNAKEEGSISAISSYQKGYELEEIAHEEDGLRVLTALEGEGWMQHLFPSWTSSKADARGLEEMHQLRAQLEQQGVTPDTSAVSMRLLTAKLPAKDLVALKKMMVRPGFVEEWSQLDDIAKGFAKEITGKPAATPSVAWKLFTAADPQAVLWTGLTSKSSAIQAQFRNFTAVWPEARQKVPPALMLEMRITPDLAGYDAMLQQAFLAAIDGKLETEDQMRAFLEPYSPPAPPPPVTVRRSRGSRKSEGKAQKKAVEAHESAAESGTAGEPRSSQTKVKGQKKGGVGAGAEVSGKPAAQESAAAPQKQHKQKEVSGKGKKGSAQPTSPKHVIEKPAAKKSSPSQGHARKAADSKAHSGGPAKTAKRSSSKAKAAEHPGKEGHKAASHVPASNKKHSAGKNSTNKKKR